MAKKKQAQLKESEMKQDEAKMKHAEDEAKKHEADGEVVGDPAHKDEQQDIELIKKMIAEYLGEEELGEAESEAMHELAKEAYEAFKQMGYKEEEAQAAAGHALKLAKHMASKQAESKEGECSEDEAKQSEACQDEAKQSEAEGEAKQTEAEEKPEEEEKEEESHKEATKSRALELEKRLIETQGELAALKLQLSKGEVERYVETKLAESKRPKAITRAFREAAGKIHSKRDFDLKWAVFCEGLKNSAEAIDYGAFFTEKNALKESDKNEKTAALDFSDCAN